MNCLCGIFVASDNGRSKFIKCGPWAACRATRSCEARTRNHLAALRTKASPPQAALSTLLLPAILHRPRSRAATARNLCSLVAWSRCAAATRALRTLAPPRVRSPPAGLRKRSGRCRWRPTSTCAAKPAAAAAPAAAPAAATAAAATAAREAAAASAVAGAAAALAVAVVAAVAAGATAAAAAPAVAAGAAAAAAAAAATAAARCRCLPPQCRPPR